MRSFDNEVTGLFESLRKNSQNMEGVTEPFRDRGPDLFNKVESTVNHLDELLSQFVEFGKVLNDSEGSLGQFMNNPDLYRSLNSAAERLDKALTELQLLLQKFKAEGIKVGL